MKFLVLLFLVGYASASFRHDSKDATDETFNLVVEGLGHASALEFFSELAVNEDKTGEDFNVDLGTHLKERLLQLLQRIKDRIEAENIIPLSFWEEVSEYRHQLKDLKLNPGEKINKLIEDVKEKLQEKLEKLLEKMGLKDTSNAPQKASFNIKDFFGKIKKLLLSKIDKEELKRKVEKLFGKGSELADRIFEMIKEKGRQGKEKILELIDRVLKADDQARLEKQKSLEGLWEKIEEYFKERNIEFQEKYKNFREFVTEFLHKTIKKGKDKAENMKEIAKKFIENIEYVSKEVAVEALDFFHHGRDLLGTVFEDVEEAIKKILKRKD